MDTGGDDNNHIVMQDHFISKLSESLHTEGPSEMAISIGSGDDHSVAATLARDSAHGMARKSVIDEEDDVIDIDGQDGLETSIKAADELKAAIGQSQVEAANVGHDTGSGPPGHEPPYQAALEEEEEDIDIVEVDEEEEAKVKQAMGVGEGMPLLDSEYAPLSGFSACADDVLIPDEESGQAMFDSGADGPEPSFFGSSSKGKRGLRSKRKLGVGSGEPDSVDVNAQELANARRTRQRTVQAAFQTSTIGEIHCGPAEADSNALNTGLSGQDHSRQRPGPGMLGRPVNPPQKEPLVKFEIKSFAVPDLVVSLPESSTVGDLKKAIMDSAMRTLAGGLRVRVLMQGKQLQHEGLTLAQAGISRSMSASGKPAESLSFMLEPSTANESDPSDSGPVLVLSEARITSTAGPSYDDASPSQPLFGVSTRAMEKMKPHGGKVKPVDDINDDDQDEEYDVDDDVYIDTHEHTRNGRGAAAGSSSHGTRIAAAQAMAAIRAQAAANSGEGIKMEGEGGAMSAGLIGAESGALVLHSSVTVGQGHGTMGMSGAHPVSMVQHKARSSSSMSLLGLEGRRRVRRPFTVNEVISLVEAVEKLGTGRWREVKLHAFTHAKHRTYVDLKDKWKTLVHTAQIAPHQRRGEPVPPELLERVTKAHAYWTAQMRAQQGDR